MKTPEIKSFAELQSSTDEVASLAKYSETERHIFSEFSLLVHKFNPILHDLKDNDNNSMAEDSIPIRKSVESLEKELNRAKALLLTKTTVKHIEDMTHDLGRSLGLLLFASIDDISIDVKQKMGALHKEMMKARFDLDLDLNLSSSSNQSQSHQSDFVNYLDEEEEEEEDEIVEHEIITPDVEQIVLQLKYGDDEEFKLALLGLHDLIRGKLVDNEWIDDEGIIPILFNRLASIKTTGHRFVIIQILRDLASEYAENKEKMADVGSLSILVKSLTREMKERREAVGLLLTLSDLPSVKRRIGRIQGCIVMLVAMLNGHDDDPFASRDSGKLLNALSSNAQNALHMAEAGYFKPLVQYLKEGSDMSKILMATAISRMELTDQTLVSLGEDGAIEPLAKMFTTGKLEAKLSSLSALQNLSSLTDNIQRLIGSGIVVPLLQLLFSVTSVLMTLREPASAILARIAQSESILVNQDVAQQMLSLLNLSSPVIQHHLLQALNSIADHSSASKVRNKMKENGAIQLLLPFLTEGSNAKIRTDALNFLCTLSKYFSTDLTDQLEETHLLFIVNIVSSSTSESEKAAAVGLLSNLSVSDKKTTNILKRAHLLPVVISMMNLTSTFATPTMMWLAESIAGVLIRFTLPSDKKLQLYSAEQGVIPVLVKLLSSGSSSPIAKSKAATSLAQLSQNSLSLKRSRTARWLCVPPTVDAFCEVHDGHCFVRSTFCLVKAGAVSPLIQTLEEGHYREADETILDALATLVQDEIWENGSNLIAKMSGVEAIIKILKMGSVKAQEKALWILERVFRVEGHRTQYGESAQVLLIDLAQSGDAKLKPTIAKLLAQLELLQVQSSYF